MPHVTRARARYAETDVGGVVYHSNYLYWFELGRTEMMRDSGYRYADFERDRGLLLTVAEAHLDYLLPVRYDDLVRIESRLTDFRRVQFTVRHRLFNEETGAEFATGYVRLACVDRGGRVRPIPSDVASALKKWIDADLPGKPPPSSVVSSDRT